MKKYDVIFIALARWDAQYASTAYSIAKTWAIHNRIFYVDNPFTINDFIRDFSDQRMKLRRNALFFGNPFIKSDMGGNLIYICPPVTLPINWLPGGFIYNFLNALNNFFFFRAIKKVINQFQIKEYIIFNSFNPFYRPFSKKFLDPKLNIYQSVDNIDQADYIKRHGPSLECLYVSKADFTITTSTELRNKLLQFSENVFLVPNAANYSLFNTATNGKLKKPKDFPPADNPVICYTGNICHRIDYELVLKIAQESNDFILMLVGPISVETRELQGLANMSNVYFLGQKKIEVLPAYLKYSHCAIIPFKINDLTKSIYPLKVNEYLAAGKPVVATRFSKDILSFKDLIYIAESNEHFLSLIRKAILEDNSDRIRERNNIAKTNTWENRVKMLTTRIENLYEYDQKK